MAGTSVPDRSHFPQGQHGVFFMSFGPATIIAEDGDTTGYKIFGILTAYFDYYVKAAYLTMREGSFVAGANALLRIRDDTGSPQTIVAARTLDTSDDTGVAMTLTIADEGPILAGGELHMEVDGGDGSAEMRELAVHLWCQPRYK